MGKLSGKFADTENLTQICNVKFKTMTGNDIKELREKYNLTQQEVADGIGAGRTRISDWETGRYEISKSYQRLLKIYFSSIQK